MPRAPRRPWWQRALALCLAVWFVAVAADVPGVHTCAMHGAGHSGAAAAMMAHAGAHHAVPTHHGAPDGAGRAACSCLGHCCGAASLAARPVGGPLLATDTHIAAPMPGRPYHEYVAAWVDFVLPFATAPPARALA